MFARDFIAARFSRRCVIRVDVSHKLNAERTSGDITFQKGKSVEWKGKRKPILIIAISIITRNVAYIRSHRLLLRYIKYSINTNGARNTRRMRV